MNKKISDFLSNKPASTIEASATVLDAIGKMNAEHHNYVLVTEGDTVAGIFTERDMLNRVLSEQKLPAEVTVSDVMTTNPDTLNRDDYISFAIERMARYGFRNIPIQDNGSEPVVLTVWHVMSHISDILADVEETEIDREIVDEMTDVGGG